MARSHNITLLGIGLNYVALRENQNRDVNFDPYSKCTTQFYGNWQTCTHALISNTKL